MIHSLKVYTIYWLRYNKIDYNEIPYDLYEFVKDFRNFFKLDVNPDDLITNFSQSKNRLLIYAAEYNYLEVVKYLHRNGANIHAENNRALRMAVKYGHQEIIKYIKQKN